ncbi:hypothetical protein [Streptomyces altiplanensis]
MHTARIGQADVVIVVLGDHPMVAGREAEDRAGIELPKKYEQLLREVVAILRECPCVRAGHRSDMTSAHP